MHKLKCLLLMICFCSGQSVFAQGDSISGVVDTNMAAQKDACNKNTAMTWSSKLNRCIGKQQAVDARNEANACDAMTDVTSKQKCQMKIAEKNSGLSSDTSSLNQGKTTASAVMNTANTAYGAYTVLNIFNKKAKSGENSNCMSKKILGITATAGLASDIYLKMKAKKKVKDLEGKFLLDTKNTAYEAQVKALEYLKEEQSTVVEIANMEKKRNMMLMLGYGLATGWAIYELTPFVENPDCVPHKQTADEKKVDADKVKTADAKKLEAANKAGNDSNTSKLNIKLDLKSVMPN
jgi:hypothetical protein